MRPRLCNPFAWFLAALLPGILLPASLFADNWGEIAIISETLGVSGSRICIGEATRGDIGCPTYAPTISDTTGHTTFSGGLTVNTVSLTTAGTTWGYLTSGASYIPNLSSNNISATTINGIAVSSFGSNSPTVISGTTSMFSGLPDAIQCSDGTNFVTLYMTNQTSSQILYEMTYSNLSLPRYYIAFNSNGSYNTQAGLSSYDCVTSTKSISQLYAEGRAFNFIGNSGAGSAALGDRLTSGTLAITANGATSTISLTTGGTTWGYLGNSSYIPYLSTNELYINTETTTGVARLELGRIGSGNRLSYIDLVGDDTYIDYGVRLIRRNTGPNADSDIVHRGTGALSLVTMEAAPIVLKTNSVTRLNISASGTTDINGPLRVNTTLQLTSPTTAPACTTETVGIMARINGKLAECRL